MDLNQFQLPLGARLRRRGKQTRGDVRWQAESISILDHCNPYPNGNTGRSIAGVAPGPQPTITPTPCVSPSLHGGMMPDRKTAYGGAGANASVAQLEEQSPCKSQVAGSIPAVGSSSMRGGAVVARLAHNQEVAGANPAPATNPRQHYEPDLPLSPVQRSHYFRTGRGGGRHLQRSPSLIELPEVGRGRADRALDMLSTHNCRRFRAPALFRWLNEKP